MDNLKERSGTLQETVKKMKMEIYDSTSSSGTESEDDFQPHSLQLQHKAPALARRLSHAKTNTPVVGGDFVSPSVFTPRYDKPFTPTISLLMNGDQSAQSEVPQRVPQAAHAANDVKAMWNTGMSKMEGRTENLTTNNNVPLNLTTGISSHHSSGRLVQGIQGAQIYVPTQNGVSKQTVLTIPLTNVTSDQVLNLVLQDGDIVPTTVRELLHLIMPINHYLESDPANDKLARQLIEMSENAAFLMTQHVKQVLDARKTENGLRKSMAGAPNAQTISSTIGNSAALYSQLTNGNIFGNFAPQNWDMSNQLNGLASANDLLDPARVNSATFQRSSTVTNSSLLCERGLLENAGLASNLTQQTSANRFGNVNDDPLINMQMQRAMFGNLNFPNLLLNGENHANDRSQLTNVSNGGNALSHEMSMHLLQKSPSAGLEDEAFKLRQLSMGFSQADAENMEMMEVSTFGQNALSRNRTKPTRLRTHSVGEGLKKRKRRTSFTPQALDVLNGEFEHNSHPSGTEITTISNDLGYDREVIRIWFCNKRQALKNTLK